MCYTLWYIKYSEDKTDIKESDDYKLYKLYSELKYKTTFIFISTEI